MLLAETEAEVPVLVWVFWLGVFALCCLIVFLFPKDSTTRAQHQAAAAWVGKLLLLVVFSPILIPLWTYYSFLNRRRQREVEEEERLEEERERLEYAERQRVEAERRVIEEQDRIERNRLEQEARARAAAERAEHDRVEREAFLQAERHNRCKKDAFVFPLDLLPKCPKCGAEEIEQIRAGDANQNGSPTLNPNDFEAGYESKIENCDYIGLGNMALEGLMRPGQHKDPDEISRYLAEAVLEAVAAKFDIPDGYSYARPHSDWHMPPQFRGQWTPDTFPQLCIFAYVLGATWKILPAPHTGLIDYFHLMADKQQAAILEARERMGKGARRHRLSDL